MALTDLIPFAEQVRDETQAGANTALRVGQLFVDIITQAAQQDQTLAQALAALPALPFDSARFYTTDNQGQDQWTGDQAIEFLCNGVVVATLPIKVAAQAYSGLLSAADKTKIDAMPADPASDGDAIGSLIASATPTSTDITPYAVDGTIKTPISVPVVSKDILQGGAINAGVVTAALSNAADLYGQGLEVKVKSGQTLTILLGGTRLYKGGVLTFTELDGTACQGFLSLSVDGLGVPVWNAATCDFAGSDSLSFDIATALQGAGYTGDYAIVTAVTLRAAAGRDVHVRLRIADSSIMQTDIHELDITQTASYVRLFGKNSGTIISQVDIPFASTTKAGIVAPQDLADLRAAHDNGLIGVNVYHEANRVTLEGDTIGGSSPTSYINAATATAAGVLTAALFTKLNALPDAASLAASLAGKSSVDDAVGSIANGQSSATGMSLDYGKVSGGYLGRSNLPLATTSANGVMSAADKTKLNGIEAGAQPNVQSDWTEGDNTSAAYIANKPTIGTAAALNVPVLGNASSSEVVKGNDSRLTNARPASDVYPWAKAENPPSVTKADVGLGNVDNTSDLNKPISTATQNALNGKQDVLPIETTSAGSTLSCVADKYYVLTSAIGTFTITLPTMTDATKAHTIGLYLTTGATPALTITGTNLIKYYAAWSIAANTTYEINALWNGVAWVLTLIEIQ